MKVIILRGVPGSGKTTWARDAYPGSSRGVAIVSANNFFTNALTGEFHHVPEDQGLAHSVCFREYLRALSYETPLVVVDNTNTKRWEISPYTLAAEAHGYKFEIIAFDCDPATAHARNIHGCTLEHIENMYRRWESPLPWWRERTIYTGVPR